VRQFGQLTGRREAGEPGTDFHLPHRYVTHCIAYTGTHDNDTAIGWLRAEPTEGLEDPGRHAFERKFALRYLGSDGEAFHWDMIRRALGSVADTVIVPLQDVLGLDADARMNTPGTASGNWTWRFRAEQVTPGVRARLADMTAVYSRWNGSIPEAFLPPRAAPAETSPATAEADVDEGSSSDGA